MTIVRNCTITAIGYFIAMAMAGVVMQPAAAVDYVRDVKPLLEHKCYACHGALKQQSGLRLDTAQSIHAGGDSGEVLDLASPEQSLLLEVIAGQSSLRMPPANEGSPLKPDEVAIVRDWIEAGAPVPEHEVPQADPLSWWSYQAIDSPTIPEVRDTSWCRNPIDHFVAAQRDGHLLQPASETSKATWLRRVYLDLIGLPPNRQELNAFLSDDAPAAYETVVERLLASPHYGERWGRHWMDVWRYSDWYGSRGSNEIRYSQRHIWRWRDWIIQSLNEDRGYDAMLREMLAADEGCDSEADIASLVATGYLGRNWYKFDRDVWLFDTVERTSEAFLGITMRCCRCHDHKFDPISQVDYYRLRAFFEPHAVRTDPLSMATPMEKDPGPGQVLTDGISLVYDRDPAVPTYRFERGDSRYPDKAQPLEPGVPASLGGTLPVIAPVELPVAVWYPALRASLRQSLAEQAAAAVAAAVSKCQLAHAQLATANSTLATAVEQPAELPPSAESLQSAVAEAERTAWLAVAELHMAQADQRSLTERIAAEVAKYIDTDKPRYASLAIQAAIAERAATLLAAEVAVVSAAISEPSIAASLALGIDSMLDQNHQSAIASGTSPVATDTDTGDATFAAQLAQLLKLSKELDPPGETLVAAREKLDVIQAEQASSTSSDSYSPLGPQYPRSSTGRRRALADWITSQQNVRTARVAVNHLWNRHFGQPLAATPENFGLNGRQPTHPALLDWLASRLMAEDWHMKPLHRLMVLSSTYRMASTGGDEAAVNVDPTNQFFGRMPARRMEAEVIRDSILHLAQQLDVSLGGPELDESAGETISRRSLYFRNTPNEKMLLLEVFDMADPNGCYRRQASVVPHQSLALMNSGLTLDQSKIIAAQLTAELAASSTQAAASDTAAMFVVAAFETVLTRGPSPEELRRCVQFLSEHAALAATEKDTRFAAGGTAKKSAALEPAVRARENLVHVLLLHNDFVTIR